MKEIRALLFDVFGTVVDWRTSLIQDFSQWGAPRFPNADWPGLIDAWRAAYIPSMNRVRHGGRRWANLDTLHRESLTDLAPNFGLPTLADPDLTHLVQGWHRLNPWPDSVPGLTRLKRRFIIAPLSNGNLSLLLNMAKHAALPWDTIFAADLFHHYKPDAETYLGAASLLNLPPHQILMTAAHNADLQAAHALGLRTAFIPRPTEYGPNQTRDLTRENTCDFVAQDIEHLAAQLSAK
jgi:2-haloacid dehalogenase